MLRNVALKSLTHQGLTVEGYSRAAVQSYWRIPELKLGFDFGAQPWDFMGTGTWFVSHYHLDHIASLPVYVARRRMMKMEPPTIYLPEHGLDAVEQMMRAFSKLDRSRMPCELVPVKAGDEIELSRENVVTVCATKHTIPSVGYIVWQRRNKLKPEFSSLSGEQIREKRLAGVEIATEQRVPLVAYLGDSTAAGLDNNPDMFKAKILIAEMTFVAPDHRQELIRKNGHMHLDDFVKRRDRFENELIIAGHFSTRYHPDQIRRHVANKFPDMLGGRLHLWL